MTVVKSIKILLADDHLLVRNGIKSLLEEEDSLKVIGEAANGQEALDLAKELKPDLLIINDHLLIGF